MDTFNFRGLAAIFALLSFGLIGAIMAGAALFPAEAEQFKRHIPTVIQGLVLVGTASTILATLGK